MANIFEQYFPEQQKYLDSIGYDPKKARQAAYGFEDLGTSSGDSSGSSSLDYHVTPPRIARPQPIDFHELSDQYGLVPRRFDTNQATQGLDDLISATQVAGGQQARNAATSYSNRLTQQGQNPVAAGVVQAQVQNQANTQVKDLTVQRDQMRLAAQKDAALVASGIAEKIAGVRQAYSQTLADYNARQSGIDLTASSTNASNNLSATELALKKRLQDAQIAQIAAPKIAQYGPDDGVGPNSWGFDPGYITNAGPLRDATVNGKRRNNTVYASY